jgi:hypothetical protein
VDNDPTGGPGIDYLLDNRHIPARAALAFRLRGFQQAGSTSVPSTNLKVVFVIAPPFRDLVPISSVFGAKIADHLAKMTDREMHELCLVLVHSVRDVSCDFPHVRAPAFPDRERPLRDADCAAPRSLPVSLVSCAGFWTQFVVACYARA